MPKITRRALPAPSKTGTPAPSTVPQPLRPYQFHGLSFRVKSGDKQASADCPWCGKDGKFSVDLKEGLWRCWSCGTGSDNGGGNVYTFLQLLWRESEKATTSYAGLAADRKLLHADTPMIWGAAQSALTGDWLLPGFSADGKLVQLYRYLRDAKTGKRHLYPTPGIGHGLHGVDLWNKDLAEVMVCEGPWDAMALWELARDKANVMAVPGCQVFAESWLPLFAGKRVSLLYDSDHPRQGPHGIAAPAGYAGMRRVAGLLANAKKPLASIAYLRWGENGYDGGLPSGWDVRDHLAAGGGDRQSAYQKLKGMIVPAPKEWCAKRGPQGAGAASGGAELEPLPCQDWKALVAAWRNAFKWRRGLEDALAVMLAVHLSCEQIGDQLFLMVIGDAGSGKTRLCEAMLVCKGCHPLEHLTGFHSGWKGSAGEDYSLLDRINHKTLITPEGDVLMSSPRFTEIMSQQRRIFDGTSGASYKNRKEDMRYTGLRTPWIIAGTPALMETDQSRLGDRFLRIFVDPPGEDEKDEILRRVAYTALRSVRQSSNGRADGQIDEDLVTAYRLTGGYADWLRANAAELLARVDADEEAVVAKCASLAQLAADLRARPNPDPKKECDPSKELPSRLTSQFMRLACCLAVVLNRWRIDGEAMARVKKVALDTARGRSLKAVRSLFQAGIGGRYLTALAVDMGVGEDRARSYLGFLRQIGVVESFAPLAANGSTGRQRWRLTQRMSLLYKGVCDAQDT